uniref:protein phosphatase 1 regulatory subunit 3E-like n=1 Tax=Myxine glutinosa TaxID=7769 RepID=UPI00358EBEB7
MESQCVSALPYSSLGLPHTVLLSSASKRRSRGNISPSCIENGPADPAARDRSAQVSPGARRRTLSLPCPSSSTEHVSPASKPCTTRKCVRFADSLGLDLAAVHRFRATDTPRIPERVLFSLYQQALLRVAFPPCLCKQSVVPSRALLEPTFPQPGKSASFAETLRKRIVCLDHVFVGELSISGLIRVLNLDLKKTVIVRYSLDRWRTYLDAVAHYVPGELEGADVPESDRFSFHLPAPHFLQVGDMLEFAICYRVAGSEYWDNNCGKNYCMVQYTAPADASVEQYTSWKKFV